MNFIFYAPASIDQGHSFWPVCLCVSLSICLSVKTFTLDVSFDWLDLQAFIFRMSIPCDKTFLLVPSSRSNIKVTVFKNGCCGGISVSQTQLDGSQNGPNGSKKIR